MQGFDFYEYAGVIVPGAVFLTGAALVEPAVMEHLQAGVTFGELGLFLILAYAAGQLIQSVGVLLGHAARKMMSATVGLPNAKILAGAKLTAEQHRRLRQRLDAEGILSVGLVKPDELAPISTGHPA